MSAERESSDVSLARSECDARPRTLRSSGAKVTSWSAPLEGFPQHTTVRIEAARARHIPLLEDAFTGLGAPSGILTVRREPHAEARAAGLVVEFDAARTSVALVVAIVAAETAEWPSATGSRGLPTDDAALTAYCSELLSDPALDTSRLIETYIIPMLNECP